MDSSQMLNIRRGGEDTRRKTEQCASDADVLHCNEVNSDLSTFAGDLVSILEDSIDSHPEWRTRLEDLLIVARECAVMSASDFWKRCEGIVQNLDDCRQEVPMGPCTFLTVRYSLLEYFFFLFTLNLYIC
ncbi:hypothetical protein Syun_031875 [Stephania yunnanensis]|uniref:IREH1/IRE-like N-terminal domain-containing protein n=1 Tax=Stephania yunnanensis TaxID=152371 RepID=A0AAP0DW69_9MAGN